MKKTYIFIFTTRQNKTHVIKRKMRHSGDADAYVIGLRMGGARDISYILVSNDNTNN